MNTQEVFTTLSTHMIQGMMFHEQLANYFDFLNLQWYRKCQEEQYMQETYEYRKVCTYYINHYNEFIPYAAVEASNIIPMQWYQHNRFDVDVNTKKNAVKEGFESWVRWEQKTKSLYEELYNELIANSDIAGAEKLRELVTDVDEELARATQKLLDLMAVNFDMDVVIPEQKDKKIKMKLEF